MRNQEPSPGNRKSNGAKRAPVSPGKGPKEAAPKESKTPDIGIDKNSATGVAKILNQALSDQHVLYIKTRNYHWNLIGKRFHTLHLFLEEQYKVLENAIDEVAERIRMVGAVPHASMKEFLAGATLEEAEGGLIDGDEAIANLLQDHDRVIIFLRKSIDTLDGKLGDAGTADFMTDLLKEHEKTAWMLRSHLL